VQRLGFNITDSEKKKVYGQTAALPIRDQPPPPAMPASHPGSQAPTNRFSPLESVVEGSRGPQTLPGARATHTPSSTSAPETKGTSRKKGDHPHPPEAVSRVDVGALLQAALDVHKAPHAGGLHKVIGTAGGGGGVEGHGWTWVGRLGGGCLEAWGKTEGPFVLPVKTQACVPCGVCCLPPRRGWSACLRRARSRARAPCTRQGTSLSSNVGGPNRHTWRWGRIKSVGRSPGVKMAWSKKILRGQFWLLWAVFGLT